MDPTVATKALGNIADDGTWGAIVVCLAVLLVVLGGTLIKMLFARAAEVKAAAEAQVVACKACREKYEAEIARLNTARLEDLKRATEEAVRSLNATRELIERYFHARTRTDTP